MKTIIWLLIIIGWSVLQARRKAMRERERRQRAAEVPEPTVVAQPAPFVRSYVDTTESGIPPELDAVMNYARSRATEANVRAIETMEPQDEVVESIVSPIPDFQDASEKPRHMFAASNSLRTFFVMREVLGPPRARKRFHPRIKAQE